MSSIKLAPARQSRAKKAETAGEAPARKPRARAAAADTKQTEETAMAHKKGLGSSRNGRDSNAKRLGVKVFAGQAVTGGESSSASAARASSPVTASGSARTTRSSQAFRASRVQRTAAAAV